ncbi:MAG TPA: hypothetical protein VGG75_41510 [Trebonia sp.]|jgi:ATP-dependent DNA ligase
MTEAAHGTTGEMPSWAKPQLATLTHERFSGPDWVYERKLDGERCLAFAGPDGVRLLNRNQRDITSTFPEIAGALAERRHTNLIADGEIVAFEGGQTRTSRASSRTASTGRVPSGCGTRARTAT